MKQFHNNGLVLSAATFILLAAQSAGAQTSQIGQTGQTGQLSEVTGVQVSVANGELNISLKTTPGENSQIFTTKVGKALVADITNSKLHLPKDKNFREDNPTPGIASIEINQVDASSLRVIVTGTNDVPNGEPIERNKDSINLSFIPAAAGNTSLDPSKKPDILVPHPQVTIDGKIAQPSGPNQPYNQAPPFLPRAVAPPVGDIAVSNIDTSPNTIDLGTQERVPRLVLRDAPVREVLSLLARAANLNLAYIGSEAATGQNPSQPGTSATNGVISLDIENEPVQDVFNYVLRMSGLDANRSGRTIFVGAKLPNSTRDIVMRSLRLNQVTVGVALNFLVSLGAESAVSRERLITNVNAVPVGGSVTALTQTQSTTETRLETQRIDFKDSTPLLRGIQALGDERTNSITLVGSPRLVDMGVAQIARLDIRRRQVVVNIKIIDVNLSNSQNYNSSFSFGIGNNFFSSDGGAGTTVIGGVNPPSSTEVRNSLVAPTVINNPYANANAFLDFNSPVQIPGTSPGVQVYNNGVLTSNTPAGAGTFYQTNGGVSSNPFTGGITGYTLATPFIVNTTPVYNSNGQVTSYTTTTTQGTVGSATAALPSLYQYPKRFLANLQAQVQTGNAKILTDPTLIVQEGQMANVNLTEEVVGNLKDEITTSGANVSKETVTAEKNNVGLTVSVKIDRIDDNGFVSLSVAPVVKAPLSSAVINLGGTSQTIFLVSERSLNSGLVRLRDGQTLILSGIIQDEDRTTVSKLPILGDIPLIGSLFRKTDRSNLRKEVIVLLTPQIMDDTERSTYGYNYTPSPDVRNLLERGGLKLQK